MRRQPGIFGSPTAAGSAYGVPQPGPQQGPREAAESAPPASTGGCVPVEDIDKTIEAAPLRRGCVGRFGTRCQSRPRFGLVQRRRTDVPDELPVLSLNRTVPVLMCGECLMAWRNGHGAPRAAHLVPDSTAAIELTLSGLLALPRALDRLRFLEVLRTLWGHGSEVDDLVLSTLRSRQGCP